MILCKTDVKITSAQFVERMKVFEAEKSAITNQIQNFFQKTKDAVTQHTHTHHHHHHSDVIGDVSDSNDEESEGAGSKKWGIGYCFGLFHYLYNGTLATIEQMVCFMFVLCCFMFVLEIVMLEWVYI